MIEQFYDLSRPLLDADERALALCREQFARLEEIKEYNQLKMLKAFTDCRVGGSHLVGTTGYGMDDAGRGKLEEVFAVLTGSEAALFRHNFMSGTHTLSVALFGVLRPGDRMVAVTGRPYDTLAGVIGIDGTHYGNLMEFGVQYDEVDLLADGTPDLAGIAGSAAGQRCVTFSAAAVTPRGPRFRWSRSKPSAAQPRRCSRISSSWWTTATESSPKNRSPPSAGQT